MVAAGLLTEPDFDKLMGSVKVSLEYQFDPPLNEIDSTLDKALA